MNRKFQEAVSKLIINWQQYEGGSTTIGRMTSVKQAALFRFSLTAIESRKRVNYGEFRVLIKYPFLPKQILITGTLHHKFQW